MINDTLSIDRFATQANTLLPKFNTLFIELGSVGTDAFAQSDYNQEVNFCNPPYSILGKLFKFITDYYP